METSDSECFESADEDFLSDTESDNSKVISSVPPKPVKLEKLSISEDKILNPTKDSNVSDEKELPKQTRSSEKDGSNVVPALKPKPGVKKPERKNKGTKPTLGVKLGTKIKSNVDSKSISSEITPAAKVNDACAKEASSSKRNNEDEVKSNVDEAEVGLKKVPESEDKEESMWNDDEDWEPTPDVNDSHKKTDDFTTDWTGWGNWGVTSLLSTATMGVTTIKNHVSQGLNTVLESGIGVPQPEELARLHKEENKFDDQQEPPATSSDSTFGLGTFVSGVTQITKLVESTSNKVISSGLDTLETIGKKTMEVLQEGDPGLKKKRAFLKIESDKPVLSQMLREAKEKAEYENKLLEEKHYSKKANYEMLFDDHQGLVHLEALEMLSRQCDIKLQTLLESHSGVDLTEMQETLNQIKELCELPEDEDETVLSNEEIEEQLNTAVSEMNIPISYNKLISTWTEADEWLQNINLNVCNELELYEQSINIMAQLTAIAVELFHKTGELLLIKEHRSTVDEADSLVQLTNSMTILLSNAAKHITEKLNEKASQSTSKERINELITNVYFEATNSSSYVKNAFQLLIPVLQVGAV